ncbi:MAG: hypothetical protein ACP5O0_09225 [Acidimicrobiales bacterium]
MSLQACHWLPKTPLGISVRSGPEARCGREVRECGASSEVAAMRESSVSLEGSICVGGDVGPSTHKLALSEKRFASALERRLLYRVHSSTTVIKRLLRSRARRATPRISLAAEKIERRRLFSYTLAALNMLQVDFADGSVSKARLWLLERGGRSFCQCYIATRVAVVE